MFNPVLWAYCCLIGGAIGGVALAVGAISAGSLGRVDEDGGDQGKQSRTATVFVVAFLLTLGILIALFLIMTRDFVWAL